LKIQHAGVSFQVKQFGASKRTKLFTGVKKIKIHGIIIMIKKADAIAFFAPPKNLFTTRQTSKRLLGTGQT